MPLTTGKPIHLIGSFMDVPQDDANREVTSIRWYAEDLQPEGEVTYLQAPKVTSMIDLATEELHVGGRAFIIKVGTINLKSGDDVIQDGFVFSYKFGEHFKTFLEWPNGKESSFGKGIRSCGLMVELE